MIGSIFPETPEFLAALVEVDAVLARCVTLRCPWPSRCRIVYDPVTRRQFMSFGAVGCPCDSLPGRRNSHPEQMSKPAWAHKVRGRHGSRAARSRFRHRGVGSTGLMAWAERLYEENTDQPTIDSRGASA
jgi:hypothetical protein